MNTVAVTFLSTEQIGLKNWGSVVPVPTVQDQQATHLCRFFHPGSACIRAGRGSGRSLENSRRCARSRAPTPGTGPHLAGEVSCSQPLVVCVVSSIDLPPEVTTHGFRDLLRRTSWQNLWLRSNSGLMLPSRTISRRYDKVLTVSEKSTMTRV